MINLKNKFIEVFEPTMSAKGFSRKGGVFHRIVNGQIAQLLSLKKFAGGYEYTPQFLIHPLCLETDFATFMDDIRMSEFFADVQEWGFSNEKDLGKMPLVLQEVEQYLFPLFDTIIDYSTYWEHLNSQELKIYDGRLYIMSLAVGKYDISQQSREAYIKRVIEVQKMNREYDEICVKELKLNQMPDYNITISRQKEFLEAKQQRFEKECEEYYQVRDAITRNDTDYIEAYIRDREQESLDSYVKAYTTPNKYKAYLMTGLLPFKFVTVNDISSIFES